MTPPPLLDPLEDALAHPPSLDADGARFTRGVMDCLPARRGPSRAFLLGWGGALGAATAAALLVRSAGRLGPALLAAARGSLPGGDGLAALLVVGLLALTAGAVATGELRAPARAGPR